jgi:hypothetical protein
VIAAGPVPDVWARFRDGVSAEDLRAGARLLRDLPAYLRDPLSVEDAREMLRRRLERREADFLTLLRRIFRSGAAPPYRELLALAGCEEGDLTALVRREGLEEALRALYRHGVYLRQTSSRVAVRWCEGAGRWRSGRAASEIPGSFRISPSGAVAAAVRERRYRSTWRSCVTARSTCVWRWRPAEA